MLPHEIEPLQGESTDESIDIIGKCLTTNSMNLWSYMTDDYDNVHEYSGSLIAFRHVDTNNG